MNKPENFEFKAEMKQLLHLIIHSLYTNPEIFIRELISNSSDALNKIRFRQLTDTNIIDANISLAINIQANKEDSSFSIEDSGIGMTKDELVNNIGTIASSGTTEFLNQLKAENSGKADINQLIGKFGVGFYSVFMVTDEVTIETRSSELNSVAYKWISCGENNFTIEESDRQTRGTKISFKLKEEYKKYAEEYNIEQAINKFSNFVDFPIYINDKEIKRVTAIWQLKKEDITDEQLDEFYKFISNDYQKPLSHLVLNIEGNINFKSILFIPETAPAALFRDVNESTLHLYVNRVFIQNDAKALLPDYLRFVKGVVDTEDLPLNVSREFTQNSPVMAKIKNVLTSRILSWIEDLAAKESDQFRKFYDNFSSLLKTGLYTDFANKNKIIDLLRFESTKTKENEMISLKEYVLRMKSDQKEIYYISGTSRELVENNPNIEYFKKNEIEVLFFTDPVDVFIIPYIDNYEEKLIKSIDKTDIDFSVNDKKTDENAEKNTEEKTGIISKFKEILKDKVEDVVVSKRLVSSPVSLVVGNTGMDSQMEKVMQMINKDFQSSKKILEVNVNHKLIENLNRIYNENNNSEILETAINQLFESVLLIEGQIKDPNEFVKRMIGFMTEATE